MKKSIFLATLMLFFSSAILTAQVTIGTNEDPHPAAVLDLKSTTTPGKGLLLPKVELSNVLFFGLGGNETKAEGMIVYCPGQYINAGVYLWTGSKWELLFAMSPSLAPSPAIKESSDNETNIK